MPIPHVLYTSVLYLSYSKLILTKKIITANEEELYKVDSNAKGWFKGSGAMSSQEKNEFPQKVETYCFVEVQKSLLKCLHCETESKVY